MGHVWSKVRQNAIRLAGQSRYKTAVPCPAKVRKIAAKPAASARREVCVFVLCKPDRLCYTLPAREHLRRLFLGSSAVEHSTVNRMVAGSNPARGAISHKSEHGAAGTCVNIDQTRDVRCSARGDWARVAHAVRAALTEWSL